MQHRTVIPAIMRLRGAPLETITTEQYNDLIDIVYESIAPGQEPRMKKDEFMALPASPLELMAAIPIIMQQAGMVAAEPSTGEASAGR